MEFVVPPADSSVFFPISVRFTATNTFSDLKVCPLFSILVASCYFLNHDNGIVVVLNVCWIFLYTMDLNEIRILSEIVNMSVLISLLKLIFIRLSCMVEQFLISFTGFSLITPNPTYKFINPYPTYPNKLHHPHSGCGNCSRWIDVSLKLGPNKGWCVIVVLEYNLIFFRTFRIWFSFLGSTLRVCFCYKEIKNEKLGLCSNVT